jgi:hypothetical protein
MSYASTLARARLLPQADPAFIARLSNGERDIDFPVSEADLVRDAVWFADVYGRLGVGTGAHVLVSSRSWHGAWYDQTRTAAHHVGARYSNVEAWAWDAPRMASFLRRFSIDVLVGLGIDSVGALDAMEDGERLLASPAHVLAEPAAAKVLRERGIRAGVIARIGPALAVSDPSGDGLIFDESQWSITDLDGVLHVTTRGARAARFDHQATDQTGRVSIIDGGARVHLEGLA